MFGFVNDSIPRETHVRRLPLSSPTQGRRPRAAVCFHGGTRSLRQTAAALVSNVVAPLAEHMEVDVFAVTYYRDADNKPREALLQEMALLHPTDSEVFEEVEIPTGSESLKWYELEHVNNWKGAAVQAAVRQWYGWERLFCCLD